MFTGGAFLIAQPAAFPPLKPRFSPENNVSLAATVAVLVSFLNWFTHRVRVTSSVP